MKIFTLIIILLVSNLNCAQETDKIDVVQQLTWGGKAAVESYAPEGTLDVITVSITNTSEEINTLKVVVDMKTLSQENKQLEGHLKQEDFFHVKKYPTAIFELTKTTAIVDGTARLIGNMTIKGTTLEEQITAKVTIDNGTTMIEFNHTMDRTNYGITYNSPTVFEKLKENAIADNFTLKGSLVFTGD